MAKPGRRPIPTKLKIIKSTDQPCRVLKKEPKPPADAIEMPTGLSPAARKHWGKICTQLTAAKIITNIDCDALRMYCEAYSTWVLATKKMQRAGPVGGRTRKTGPFEGPDYSAPKEGGTTYAALLERKR